MFGARASEKSIYQLMGTLGNAFTPINEWKDVGVVLAEKEKVCRLKVATKDMLCLTNMTSRR